MTALTMADAHACLNAGHLAVAFQRAWPYRGAWMEPEDVTQMGWEVCGQIAQRYVPHANTPAAHYVVASFARGLGHAVRRSDDNYRAPGVQVYSRPHAAICMQREGTTEGEDYALSAACAELLRVLPAQERHVLWLCAVEGLSLTQAAAHLGLGRSTVYDAYHRAIALARAFWSEAA